MLASFRTRGRVFAAAVAFYAAGVSFAALTGIPNALEVSVVLVAATTWAFGARYGVATVAGDLLAGFALFDQGVLEAEVPAWMELIPGAFTDGFVCVAVAALRRAEFRQAAGDAQLRGKNAELEAALAEVKELRGMLPICAWCKCVRDVNGIWNQLEAYLARHSHATFTHGVCPTCAAGLAHEAQSLPPTG
jgi:hypothetical protein